MTRALERVGDLAYPELQNEPTFQRDTLLTTMNPSIAATNGTPEP
jgi:hypothetical protein